MAKKDKIQLAITGVLVIVLIFVTKGAERAIKKTQGLRRQTLRSGVLEKKMDTKETEEFKISAGGWEGEDTYKKLEELTKNLQLTRDPFSKATVAKPKEFPLALRLRGIVWHNGDSQAVINEKVVYVGDSIDKYVVVDIKKNSVILSDGTHNFELKLGK